jgi:toxin ParE1/3/4
VKDVVPRELANRDVEEAIEHYLVESTAKVALGFVDELEKAYAHIARHPSSGGCCTNTATSRPG